MLRDLLKSKHSKILKPINEQVTLLIVECWIVTMNKQTSLKYKLLLLVEENILNTGTVLALE